VEGHALYLRDPLADEAQDKDKGRRRRLSAVQAIKLAAVADVFGQTEYALEVLDWVKGRLAAADAVTPAAIDSAVVGAIGRLGAL
jgi:hypothetical protein